MVALQHIILVTSFLVTVAEASVLGQLHWCSPLCLCHDDTNQEMHCFKPVDIYNLMAIDQRKINALLSAFDMENKLHWCTDNCLCHRENQKEFKCALDVNLKLIGQLVPELKPYMEPKPVEIYEVVDIPVTEEPELEKKDKKDKKKHKKNRKHKKGKKMEDMEIVDPPDTEPVVLSANVLPVFENAQVMTSAEIRDFTDMQNIVDTIRQHFSHVQRDLMLNRILALVAVGVSLLALTGLIIVCCSRSCCSKRKSKKITTTSKNDAEKPMTDGW